MSDAIVSLLWATAGYTLIFFVLGLLWVPVGCLICGAIARSRGLDVGLWVKRAALSSALLFVPWFYAVACVCGLRIPRIFIWTGYALVYSAWLAGPIAFTIGYTLEPVAGIWQGRSMRLAVYAFLYFPLSVSITLANLWACFTSARVLLRSQHELIWEFDFVYFRPWLLVLVSWLGLLLLGFVYAMVEGQDAYRLIADR